MSKITQYVRHLAVVAIATLLAQCAWADKVIAINFNAGQGRSNAGIAANKLANDTAVTVGAYTINGQYWTQYQCAATATHSEGVTVYDTAAGTTETKSMTVKTTAGGNHTVDTVSSPAQQTVTNGYMDDGNGVKVELSVAPFDKYDIILIQATDTASRKFAPALVNGVLYKADANGNAVLASHKTDNWGASRTSDVTLGTNAMRVNNLCGPLTIYGGRNLNSAQRGGIAGLVIIERTTPTPQVYIANEDCTASNSGGVGNYKPASMTIPASTVTPEGVKLWIDAVTFCLEVANAAKAGSITLADTQSGSPTVAGEWNVTSLDGSSSMGPRITYPFATAAKVTVGTQATMSAPTNSRFRMYNTTDEKWGVVQLNADMNAWRPAYQISARVPGCVTIDGSVAAWTDLVWEEKNPFVTGAPVELTVAGESTLTLGAAVSCAEVVITGSADLTITDPQNLTYTKLDLSGYTGKLILDHTSTTVIENNVGNDTTDYLMGNVIGGTIVLKGSSIVGFTTIGGNAIALDGTTLRIEGGLVKVNSKDKAGNLKNATIELAGGRIYNYGWFQASGTLTLDASSDTSAFCKYCSGTPAIVKKGSAKVSFEAGDTSGNFTSIKAEVGTISFSGNPVTATTLLAGAGTIEIPNGKTLTVGSLSGEGDINVTGAGTLVIQNDSEFAGTLNLSGSVAINFGNMRPSFAISTADTASVSLQTSALDDGCVTLKGEGANVSLIGADGNPITDVTTTTEGGVTKYEFPITVSGKACWIAYEFNGNLNSIGTDTTSLSRDQDDRQYRYGDAATSDFRPAGDSYDALYAGSHPWRNITYKDSFTCAMYGTLPQVDEAGLLVFGSTTSSPYGLIGLMTGSVENNTVLLVRSSGSQNNATKYETMAEMSVPNPFTTPHLYIFSKTGRTIKVYLDGILWTTYESTTDFTIGGGFQICSVHGGSFKTGVNRFAPPSREAAQNQAIYKECVIDSLRLYDGALGEKAIAELVKEFPYVSPNGSYSRTAADSSTWSETDAWTKAGDNTRSELPAVGSALTLSATTATSAITVGLNATTTYEAITFGGSEGSTISVKKGTGMVANAGQTVISVPVTIEEGAMTVSGGPTVITGAGSLAFDYSTLEVNSYNADAFIQLTGMMDAAADKVSCTLPAESTYSDRTVAFGYDTASKTYRITITMNDVEIAIPTFDNTTVGVTVNGASVAVENGQITAKAGSTVVITYTATTGYHLTAETTSQTIDGLASTSSVSITEMPVELNVYNVPVTHVENATTYVSVGDGEFEVVTAATVPVTHGQNFSAKYVANEGYMLVLPEGDTATFKTEGYNYTNLQTTPSNYPVHCAAVLIAAKVGGTNYATVAEALATEGDVTICANITGDLAIPEGKNVALSTYTVSGEIVIGEGSVLTLANNERATRGISGSGTLVTTSGTLYAKNKTDGYALDGITVKIEGGAVRLETGIAGAFGDNDSTVRNVKFVIGENSTLTNRGWVNMEGTIEFSSDYEKTVIGNHDPAFRGTPAIVKSGSGAITFAPASNNGSKFTSLTLNGGSLKFNSAITVDATSTDVEGKVVAFDETTKTYSLVEMTAKEKLLAAIDAAEAGATVTATGDITFDNNEYVEKPVVIDLDDNTMTVTSDASGIMFHATIVNGTIEKVGTGSIQFTPDTTATITLNAGSVSVVNGTLTVESGIADKVVDEATYGQMKYYSLTDPAPAELTFSLGTLPDHVIAMVYVGTSIVDASSGSFTATVGDTVVIYYAYEEGYIGDKISAVRFTVTDGMTTSIPAPEATAHKVTAVVIKGEEEYKEYASIVEAIANGNGATVTLLDDLELGSAAPITIPSGVGVAINFNGHTISRTTSSNYVLDIVGGAEVILADGTESGNGGMKGTPVASGNTKNPASLIRNKGTLAIVSGRYQSDYTVVKNDEDPGKGVLVVDGGTLEIIANDKGYTGLTFAIMNWTDATINGGTFNGNVQALSYNGNSVCKASTLTINGGTFVVPPTVYMIAYDTIQTPTITVKDGVEISVVNASSEAFDLEVKQNGNVYTLAPILYVAQIGEKKYKTLQAALDDVTADATVTLLADTSADARIVYTGTPAITLDLNGKMITSTADVALINKGGEMTITGEGTIDASNATDPDNDCVWAHSGNIIIKNGTFINKSTTSATVYLTNSAVFTIEGGTFKNLEPTFAYGTTTETHYFGVLNVNNKSSVSQLVVKGGSFLGTDPAKGDDNLGGTFVADGYESIYDAETKTYTVQEKTGPTDWTEVDEDTEISAIVNTETAEALKDSTVTAKEIATWATALADKGVTVDLGAAIPVNALIFNCAPSAAPGVAEEAPTAEEAASAVLEEVIEAEKVDLAALLAKAVEAGEGGLTITSLSAEYPMATIKLVPSTKLDSTETAKFFQLSIELK